MITVVLDCDRCSERTEFRPTSIDRYDWHDCPSGAIDLTWSAPSTWKLNFDTMQALCPEHRSEERK